MARHPALRTTQLDGAEVVLVPRADYEGLDASRRQVGAQANRIRGLQQRLAAMSTFLDELEKSAAAASTGHHPHHAGNCHDSEDGCVADAMLAMLKERPDSARD
jgi:hypothetical protein